MEPGMKMVKPPQYYVDQIALLESKVRTPRTEAEGGGETVNLGMLAAVLQLELLLDIRDFIMGMAVSSGAAGLKPGQGILLAKDLPKG